MDRIAKRIASIRWSRLKTASGSAAHIPDALRGLFSMDESVQNRSYWQLDNEVVCQSDLYEAAYFVVPILIDVLREEVAHGANRTYDLLYEIANGWAPLNVTCRTTEGDEISLQEACIRELRRGLDVFRRDALSQNASIRGKASDLVGLLSRAEG